MLIKYKIVVAILFAFIWTNRIPENNSTFNYVQIFFKWNQIPNTTGYTFHIENINTLEERINELNENSILYTDFLELDSEYYWQVCGTIDGQSTDCNDLFYFKINPLSNNLNNISVTTYNSDLSVQGITIIDMDQSSSEEQSGAIAIDYDGKPIWFADMNNFYSKFVFTQFLKNGNILGYDQNGGYEINLNSDIIFQTPINLAGGIHHDFNKTDKNTYFFLSQDIQEQYCPTECNPNLPNTVPWKGDIYREIDHNGIEIWNWNTFDYIDLSQYNPYYIETFSGFGQIDWTHSNSIFFDKNSNSVFVSIRNLSRITKIDYPTKEIIWNMGQLDFMNEIYFNENLNFSQQHSAQVLDNGNILFFDNHRYLDPELSRCIEVAYDENNWTSEIVWEYILPPELFTGSRGECDRLNNGNTLISAGRTNHILEVTNMNEIVWEANINSSGIYRSERIPHLHPIAFSIEIENYTTDGIEPYVEVNNNQLSFHIYNSGWGNGWYNYGLYQSNIELKTDSIFVSPYTDEIININIDNTPSGIYTIEMHPVDALEKSESIEFNLINSFIEGDCNSDGLINILDIISLINLILIEQNDDECADLNQDELINILDIITLTNLILENN